MTSPHFVLDKSSLCPLCDDQGWVRHISLPQIKTDGFLCNECYAFWLEKGKVGPSNFTQFDDFLDLKGLDGSSVEVVFLEPDEEEPLAKKWRSFSVDRKEVLPLIDEAWSKRGKPLEQDPRAFVIDVNKNRYTVRTHAFSTILALIGFRLM